jgi:hypothetical protein
MFCHIHSQGTDAHHRKHMSRDHQPLHDVTEDTENTASSIAACWTVLTEMLPGNALIKSDTILKKRLKLINLVFRKTFSCFQQTLHLLSRGDNREKTAQANITASAREYFLHRKSMNPLIFMSIRYSHVFWARSLFPFLDLLRTFNLRKYMTMS